MTTNETFAKFLESKCNTSDRIEIIKRLLNDESVFIEIQAYILSDLDTEKINELNENVI